MTEPLPDPFADQPDWAPQPPRPIEVLPAAGQSRPARATGAGRAARPRLAGRPAGRRAGGAEQPHLRAGHPRARVVPRRVRPGRGLRTTGAGRAGLGRDGGLADHARRRRAGAASGSSRSTRRHIGHQHRSSRPTRSSADGWCTWSARRAPRPACGDRDLLGRGGRHLRTGRAGDGVVSLGLARPATNHPGGAGPFTMAGVTLKSSALAREQTRQSVTRLSRRRTATLSVGSA